MLQIARHEKSTESMFKATRAVTEQLNMKEMGSDI